MFITIITNDGAVRRVNLSKVLSISTYEEAGEMTFEFENGSIEWLLITDEVDVSVTGAWNVTRKTFNDLEAKLSVII